MPAGKSNPPPWRIVPMAQRHATSFHALVDAVARERSYLAFLEAPRLADTRRWLATTLAAKNPFFLVMVEDRAIGWCDVSRIERDTMRHVGVLGIGLARDYRHQGIGQQLMEHVIAAAWRAEFLRIELRVRQSNLNAIALYERLGFVTEGIARAATRVDEDFHDTRMMALIHERLR